MMKPTDGPEGTVGKRVREIRDFNGWTRPQLAEWSGIKYESLAQIEGGRPPSSSQLVKLANALRTSTDRLLGLAQPRSDEPGRLE